MRALMFGALVLLTGCASYQDIVSKAPAQTVQSSQAVKRAAVCIARNANDNTVLTLKSKVTEFDAHDVEVEVMGEDSRYAVVKLKSTENGSKADFYLAGMAKIAPTMAVQNLVKGCT
ncbi:hypothetical protein ACFQUU_08870 [Herbaspirillum sp. GCM10030257]|uniref:hypothetical protein n=1 Tax=Herbaspirillum sp. GCM10030257 TaxID=3273393 RepID=UPI00360ABD46